MLSKISTNHISYEAVWSLAYLCKYLQALSVGVWLIRVNVFRLENLDASTTEARAARILHGLGFTKEMQQKKTRDFSGGWRMRIALARALFVDPSML